MVVVDSSSGRAGQAMTSSGSGGERLGDRPLPEARGVLWAPTACLMALLMMQVWDWLHERQLVLPANAILVGAELFLVAPTLLLFRVARWASAFAFTFLGVYPLCARVEHWSSWPVPDTSEDVVLRSLVLHVMLFVAYFVGWYGEARLRGGEAHGPPTR